MASQGSSPSIASIPSPSLSPGTVAAASNPSSFQLSDRSCLRGVDLAEVLSECGRHFAPLARPGCGKVSREVAFIDVFLSHSWRAPRAAKFLSLSLAFNGQAAVLLGYLGLLLGVLVGRRLPIGARWNNSIEKECPFSAACSLFGLPACLVTLLFGQRLRGLVVGTSCVCFLDRLCICQDDPERKAVGIKNLGAILARSNEMLVIMDATYWQRLWCIWEVAAFIKQNQSIERPMQLIHPDRDVALAALFAPVLLHFLIMYIYEFALSSWWGNAQERKVVWLLVDVLCSSMLISVACRAVLVARRLEATLKSFRLEQASCLESTDLEFIMGKVDDWFGGAESFERYVQNDVHATVTRRTNNPLSMPLWCMLLVGLPRACYFADIMATYPYSPAWTDFAKQVVWLASGALSVDMAQSMIVLTVAQVVAEGRERSDWPRRRAIDFGTFVLRTLVQTPMFCFARHWRSTAGLVFWLAFDVALLAVCLVMPRIKVPVWQGVRAPPKVPGSRSLPSVKTGPRAASDPASGPTCGGCSPSDLSVELVRPGSSA